MSNEIGDSEFGKFTPDLSPVSDGSNSDRINTGGRVEDKYNIFNDNSSLLGVIVDRSSFDEDDELTTFGRDSASIFNGHSARLNLPLHQDLDSDLPPLGGIVMKNGRVRRKMRWKPRFRKKTPSNKLSSNASVVSALTNRSSATTRSTSTTRSFLSHFSRRSNTSYHTFHSTATPVATNKTNRPQAPHTVMRPNYQDSFESLPTRPKHSTIDSEGKYMQRQEAFGVASSSGFPSTKLDSVIEGPPSEDLDVIRSSSFSSMDRVGEENEDNSIPLSDSNTNGIAAINITSSSNISVGATSALSGISKDDIEKPPIPLTIKGNKSSTQQQSKQRRPPLFKRVLRNNKNKSSNNSNPNNNSEQNVSSPTETNSTASLSSPISLERENSGLPVLQGDEKDRRVQMGVQMDVTRSLFTDFEDSVTKPKLALEGGKTLADDIVEEEPDETSVSPSVSPTEQSSLSGSLSGSQSASSAVLSRNTTPVSLQKESSSISNNRSTSSTSSSTGSSLGRTTSLNSSTVPTVTEAPTETAIEPAESKPAAGNITTFAPFDPDEGAFLEAEHNLRAIHEMAAEHLAHGEFEEAAEVFEEILRGQQERYGQDHYRVGTALHNLGIVYLRKKDFAKAIEVCQRAVDVRKDSLVPNHPDVALSLSQLGVAHLESQNYNEALEAFRAALNIRQNFLGPKHMKCSKILNNIGCALYSLDELPESKRAFDEALDIQRQGLRSLPTIENSDSNDISNGMQSNSLLLSMASTLCNIGSIRMRWGDFDKADIALEEALLIQQSVLGDDHPTVNSTMESIRLVETAKYCAANPASYNAFLMKYADAACTVANPSNVMTELLGIGNFEQDDWFVNPCAPMTNFQD